MFNYLSAPNSLGPCFRRYIEDKIPPGGFVLAVLCNDLKEACARADDINRRLLWEIVAWLYNEAPSDCWGSPERVEAWLSDKARIATAEAGGISGRWS